MHFPHLRLAQNRFQWWETPDDFRAAQEEVTRRLEEEGWHHTASLSINPVQVGVDKVHLVIRQSRQRPLGRAVPFIVSDEYPGQWLRFIRTTLMC
jgi:hypothetical protein